MLWDTHLTRDMNALEAVQRFACMVCTKSWIGVIVTCCNLWTFHGSLRGDDCLIVSPVQDHPYMHLYCLNLVPTTSQACTSFHPFVTSDSH